MYVIATHRDEQLQKIGRNNIQSGNTHKLKENWCCPEYSNGIKILKNVNSDTDIFLKPDCN